jgi:hypothetical protein
MEPIEQLRRRGAPVGPIGCRPFGPELDDNNQASWRRGRADPWLFVNEARRQRRAAIRVRRLSRRKRFGNGSVANRSPGP